MSSTNRGGARRDGDTYYTPDAVARACVTTLPSPQTGEWILEPSAGGGAFMRAAKTRWPAANILGVDIDPYAPIAYAADFRVLCVDFLQYNPPTKPAWVIGNPPFSDAEAHVRHALKLAIVGVAFLLRLAFLESTKRAAFWGEHPPAEVHVLSRRPSFTGGGTDSAAYGWFVWTIGHQAEAPRLFWLDWSKA